MASFVDTNIDVSCIHIILWSNVLLILTTQTPASTVSVKTNNPRVEARRPNSPTRRSVMTSDTGRMLERVRSVLVLVKVSKASTFTTTITVKTNILIT